MDQSTINFLTEFFILILVLVCVSLIIAILRLRYITANEFVKEEKQPVVYFCYKVIKFHIYIII